MSDPVKNSYAAEIKRPIAVTLSLILHILCVLWLLYGVWLFFQRVTWRMYTVFGIFLLIHFIGIHGLRMRRKWAKGYSKTVFIFYVVIQFWALNRSAKSGDHAGLLLSILIGGFILWLLNALNQVEVESYLNIPKKT